MNPTVQLAIAIALWCGNPTWNGLTSREVQTCRERLKTCLSKTTKVSECFEKEKLK